MISDDNSQAGPGVSTEPMAHDGADDDRFAMMVRCAARHPATRRHFAVLLDAQPLCAARKAEIWRSFLEAGGEPALTGPVS
jgi:hypothetical protein